MPASRPELGSSRKKRRCRSGCCSIAFKLHSEPSPPGSGSRRLVSLSLVSGRPGVRRALFGPWVAWAGARSLSRLAPHARRLLLVCWGSVCPATAVVVVGSFVAVRFGS